MNIFEKEELELIELINLNDEKEIDDYVIKEKQSRKQSINFVCMFFILTALLAFMNAPSNTVAMLAVVLVMFVMKLTSANQKIRLLLISKELKKIYRTTKST